MSAKGVTFKRNGQHLPAFPTPDYFEEHVVGVQPGLELRDYIAARVLPFCCIHHVKSKLSEVEHAQRAATHAYLIADAVLAARR